MWMALGGVLIAIAAMVDVRTIGPRVTVRWRDGITAQEREALERRHDNRFEDMDVVFAVFPALYASAWLCAHDPKRTRVAAAVVVVAHLAFWRIVLDSRFVNQTL